MQIINSIIQFIMDLGGAIFLPFMITILGLFFKIKFFDSFRNGLRIGAGFLGITVILEMLCSCLNPAVEFYSGVGSGFTVIDIGWEGIAAIAWSTPFALIIVPICLVLNYFLIRLRFTKTMDVDVWNYFHVILGAAMAYYVAQLAGLSASAAIIAAMLVAVGTFVIILKMADWVAPYWQKHYNLPGTTCCNNDAFQIWAIDYVVCWIMDRIPVINKINLNAKWFSDKFGSLGETSVLTFFVGILISLITRQDLATMLTMSVTLSAAIVILPRMVSLLMEGLNPISNAARKIFKQKLGDGYDIYIGMDEALCLGDESGIQCAALMIPIGLAVAFLPGVNFFPIASLGSMVYTTCMCSLFARGDILKTVIASTVNCIYSYQVLSWMAPLVTKLAVNTGYITNTAGMVTGSSVEEFHCLIIALVSKLFGVW